MTRDMFAKTPFFRKESVSNFSGVAIRVVFISNVTFIKIILVLAKTALKLI